MENFALSLLHVTSGKECLGYLKVEQKGTCTFVMHKDSEENGKLCPFSLPSVYSTWQNTFSDIVTKNIFIRIIRIYIYASVSVSPLLLSPLPSPSLLSPLLSSPITWPGSVSFSISHTHQRGFPWRPPLVCGDLQRRTSATKE